MRIGGVVVLSVSIFSVGCAGSTKPAPAWFAEPPPNSGRDLFFVGDASSAPDEGMARDLAVQKALASLSQYCGAVVKSDFTSLERETNGKLEQMVALSVDIAGEELTLREVVVEETSIRKGTSGGFDGFALIRWPRAQYRQVLAMQRARGERALTMFRSAEDAFKASKVDETRTRLDEARQILGPARAQLPLSDPRIAHTGLLWDAVEALDRRVEAFEKARRRVVAVGVDCLAREARIACPKHRVGRVLAKVTDAGLEISDRALPAELTRQIASAAAPQIDAKVRDSGYVLAVTYDARLLGEEDGFTFARCGARGVVYDTDTGRIVGMTEVKGRKGGHIHFEGAAEKGCSQAEKELSGWLGQVVTEMQADSSGTRGTSQ